MNNLKQVFAQEDTVLFVGSGLSLWAGLPSWSQLIEELAVFVEAAGANADLVRAEAQRGDLLQAASYGFYKLSKPQIGDFIRKACRYGVAKPQEVHRKLVSLGPRCYITTNYDNLIEESLRIWQSDRFFRPPVTNRHLTETAEIVHARAKDFVFKPHGDAGDSESIVLTREQYRQLLPGGERQAALESLKMLMVSRPVVYIGFGLRDPDFLYVRDLLSNTYKGGVRDHYAIVADILESEVDYWRVTYGIHLVGYATTERTDKSKDHGALLELLSQLSAGSPALAPVSTALNAASYSSDTILSLARHAARLGRAPKVDPEYPVRVHSENVGRAKAQSDFKLDRFDYCPVMRFLENGPRRAILVGAPGAGKSYSLQRAAARLADRLHQSCLAEKFDEKDVTIPLLADLKLYRGDVVDLINRTLPGGMPFDWLATHLTVKIFLDSFNEMPREFRDSGTYEADFARFAANYANVSLIVGSRTSDGLSKLEFPFYRLEQIDKEFVRAELERLRIDVSGRFQSEVLTLLQKPFYFQLVASGAIVLPTNGHPKDFYQAFFVRLTSSFRDRFGTAFDLECALSLAAFEATDQGEEAQPLSKVIQVLEDRVKAAGIAEIDAYDVANWLVSKFVLIPFQGARVAFFHQSATEYLAASELARRYRRDPRVLKERLSLTRWDQALFLTLSLLPESEHLGFLQTLIDADFALALNATKYLELNRDEVVGSLLSEIPARLAQRGSLDRRIEAAVQFAIEVSDVHEPQLRELMNCGDAIGAAAVHRLVEFKGSAVKDELIQALVHARADFNYCRNGIASALRPFATPDDAYTIVALADSIEMETPPGSDDRLTHGLTSGAANFLSGLNIGVIRRAFLPAEDSKPLSEVRSRILCDILLEHRSTSALELAAELLLRRVNRAATAIYFIAAFAKPKDMLSWAGFDRRHVDRLISIIQDKSDESWALRALKFLCKNRPDLSEVVRYHASSAGFIVKAALLFCVSSGDAGPVFEAMAEFARMDSDSRAAQPVHVLGQMDLGWSGHEELLIKLLRLRDMQLALVLLGTVYQDPSLSEVDIGPTEWWLDWLLEEGDESRFWFRYQMACLLSIVLSGDARTTLLAELNSADLRVRRVLADYILPRFTNLTIDSLSDDAISFLLADLNRKSAVWFDDHLLGRIATEQFVTERLLPLLPEAKPPFSVGLREVLRQAGSRHGRRYINA